MTGSGRRLSWEYTPVAVHGAPRSGTTWVGEIINSSPRTVYRYQPLFSYAHKGFLGPESGPEEIANFFDRLDRCDDAFTNQLDKRQQGLHPSFAKEDRTHVVYKEVRYHHILDNLLRQCEPLKLVAIVRNPLSVLNSWLNAPREFRADLGWRALEEWRGAARKNLGRPEEFNGFEKWKEVANGFLDLQQRFPQRVYLLTYGALLSQPEPGVRQLFEFLGLDYGPATAQFLASSSAAADVDPYSVYRSGQTDDRWRSELLPEIAEAIQAELAGDPLARFLE